jgi:hypothetical protein
MSSNSVRLTPLPGCLTVGRLAAGSRRTMRWTASVESPVRLVRCSGLGLIPTVDDGLRSDRHG